MQCGVLSSISNKQLVLMTWLAKLEVFGSYFVQRAHNLYCRYKLCALCTKRAHNLCALFDDADNCIVEVICITSTMQKYKI